jgi:replicative DNA helicase
MTVTRAQKVTKPPEVEQPTAVDSVSIPATIEVFSDHASQVAACSLALEDADARAKLIALGVTEEFFSVPQYRGIWGAIEAAHDRGIVLDRTTIAAYVDDPKLVDLAEGMRQHRPSSANVIDIVDRLRWGTAIIDAAGEIPALIELVRRQSSKREDTIRAARSIVDSLESGVGIRNRFDKDKNLAARQAEAIKNRKTRGRYPFGLPGFDVDDSFPETDSRHYRTTVGTAPGKTTVLTALSGNGKSTVLDNIVLAQVSGPKPRKTLYGAWEDEPGDVLERMAALECGISLTRLTMGTLTDEEEKRHAEVMARLERFIQFMPNPVMRMKRSRFRNDEVLSMIHGQIVESGADFVVFDLWARAFAFGSEQEEAESLYRQQAIATATGAHQILVQQQLLKTVEKRDDKRPSREGTKGSGEWTGIADTMLGVFRIDLYKNVPAGTIEVDIMKQRKGRWPLAIEFDFDPELGRLKNGRGVPYDSPGVEAAESTNTLDKMIGSKKNATKKKR